MRRQDDPRRRPPHGAEVRGTALSTGDAFTETRALDGSFYETGAARVGIRLWGNDDEWAISVFSAAPVNMTPTLALYRFISRWRTTSGTGAPYVVEDGDGAAVMCERGYQSSQLASDTTAWRLIASTIDLVGESALPIARRSTAPTASPSPPAVRSASSCCTGGGRSTTKPSPAPCAPPERPPETGVPVIFLIVVAIVVVAIVGFRIARNGRARDEYEQRSAQQPSTPC